jgi:RES domain-containing protein
MVVYRIVKSEERTRDLSGKGAFIDGGRWNNPGIFLLYTSMNSSLALLENLVHFDEAELPPRMFVIHIEIDETVTIYQFPDEDLPKNWRQPENFELKEIGDKLIKGNQYMAIKVRSAVNPDEYNILLNPLFPAYYDLVKVIAAEPYTLDQRLI